MDIKVTPEAATTLGRTSILAPLAMAPRRGRRHVGAKRRLFHSSASEGYGILVICMDMYADSIYDSVTSHHGARCLGMLGPLYMMEKPPLKFMLVNYGSLDGTMDLNSVTDVVLLFHSESKLNPTRTKDFKPCSPPRTRITTLCNALGLKVTAAEGMGRSDDWLFAMTPFLQPMKDMWTITYATAEHSM